MALRLNFDLSPFGKIRLTGKDRGAFLQNFTTNDVVKPGPGHGCETFLTTAQARIVAWLRVAICEQSIDLNMEPELAPKVISHLERYVIGEDVQLEDRTTRDALFLVHEHPDLDQLALWQQQSLNHGFILQRCDFLGSPSGFVWGPRDALSQLQLPSDLIRLDDPRWNQLRLDAGTPAYNMDFDESNLPQEVNRTEQAISFTKGCYIGQETVARIRAYGHVNRQLKRVVLIGPVDDGNRWMNESLMFNGKEVGKLKTVARSPSQSWLAFAMLRKEYVASDTVLQVKDGVEAKVI
jgi:folate-binding protein YgfZ